MGREGSESALLTGVATPFSDDVSPTLVIYPGERQLRPDRPRKAPRSRGVARPTHTRACPEHTGVPGRAGAVLGVSLGCQFLGLWLLLVLVQRT